MTHDRSGVWTEGERPRLRLHEVLHETARRFPDNEAIVAHDARFTFAELEDQVHALQEHLAKAGVGRDARVAVSTAGDALDAAVLYAVSAAGAVTIPLNPYWTENEITDVLQRSSASHLVVAPPASNPAADTVTRARSALEQGRRPLLGTVTPEHIAWTTGEPLAPGQLDDTIAMIMFTSGSTGKPKAALQPHLALVGSAHYYRRALDLGPDDRYLLLLPIYHTSGIVDGLLASHLAGATTVILPDFDAERVLETYESERITVTTAFGSMLHKIESSPGYVRERHRWLKKAGLAGDARMYDRLLDAGVELIIPSYALTETCGGLAVARPTCPDRERKHTVGESLPGVEIRIVDVHDESVLATSERGEIWVRGWTLFAGYLDGDSGVDEYGWLHTGDLGCLTDGGLLSYEGRIKNMVKSGGENVSEFEVETYLASNVPELRQACVVGVPDDEWTEMVVAYVEMLPAGRFDPVALSAICKRGLAGYKVPKRFWQIKPAEWPMLASGKTDKATVRKLAASRKACEERVA
jgi:acyl-CoA synthetase (AMP-forming)/AMP-acid ligase II